MYGLAVGATGEVGVLGLNGSVDGAIKAAAEAYRYIITGAGEVIG